MKASEIGRIVEQLKQAHEGEAWHGPSLREALDGVSAQKAGRRPIAGAHSIWEIVHHVRVVEETVRARLNGEAAPDEADWPALEDTREKAWATALANLEETRRALRDAVASLPEARLHENLPGQSHSYWHELLGILHHDLYHAGQISLLKRG
jgi:uncharacterized damage-inducible protein DinB